MFGSTVSSKYAYYLKVHSSTVSWTVILASNCWPTWRSYQRIANVKKFLNQLANETGQLANGTGIHVSKFYSKFLYMAIYEEHKTVRKKQYENLERCVAQLYYRFLETRFFSTWHWTFKKIQNI